MDAEVVRWKPYPRLVKLECVGEDCWVGEVRVGVVTKGISCLS